MNAHKEWDLTLEDHQEASAEVGFLLDIYTATIDDLMGGATASVGRIAGRHMANKLPIYMPDPTLDETLEVLAENLVKGFEITCQCDKDGADLDFGRCVIRKVCAIRNLTPGGAICKLFHHYVDGIVNEIFFRPTKSKIVSVGKHCSVRLEVR